MAPLRGSAAGKSSTMAIESMNPAPKATSSSMTRSSRTARRVTASAPRTLPAAATRAYNSALDTGQEIRSRVTRRIVENFLQQAAQHLAHIRTRPHAGRDEVIAFDREILERERRVLGADGGDGVQEPGARS